MLIVIDAHNGIPVYRQIVEQVRFQVASGLLKTGDELPSTRTLSQELGVNPMTVSKAYSLLEAEHVVTRRPGLPLVVSDRPAARVDADRAAQLEAALRPAALAARQLGVPTRQAVGIYRRLLDETTDQEEPGT